MSKKQNHIRRKRKWPWILGGIILIAVAAVFLLPFLLPGPIASTTQSMSVMRGSIVQTVVGTGSLQNGDEVTVEIPIGIKILEVDVESDNSFEKGDVLATIDPISLQSKITSTKAEIDSLEESIERSKYDTDYEYVVPNVTGRVKKIYAEEEKLVSAVMSEHGALLLISLDGMMAVDIVTSQPLSIGDEVAVVLESGYEEYGEVEKSTSDGYTITLTDYGPRLDEQVEVKDWNGEVLGSGSLYIHQPIKITGSSGTIDAIWISEDEIAYSGYAVIALKQLPSTAEYQKLLASHEEQTDLLNILLSLAETNTFIAESDGVVRSVYISENQTTSASAGILGSTSDSNNSSSADMSSSTGTPSNGYTSPSASSDTSDGAPSNASPGVSGGSDLFMTAFTISQSDQLVLKIEVDELDILTIQKDQEATVTLDAIPNEEFEGVVTKIASSPAATTGVAKYSVEITLQKDPSMRIGMNATATIRIDQKDDILTLPLEAVQESSGRVFIYTSMDERTGALGGEKDITTGISDGTTVEILSGLSEGDTVFFQIKTSNTSFGGGGFGPDYEGNNIGQQGGFGQ